MSSVIKVTKLNDVYMRLDSDISTQYEISDYFTFSAPNAKFDPRVRARKWDGKLRLFNLKTRRLYIGLLDELRKLCELNGHTLEFAPGSETIESKRDISAEDMVNFLQERVCPHKDGNPLPYRDYQLAAAFYGLRNNRALILSPTASGKSLIIYSIIRVLQAIQRPRPKILLVVPTTALVEQMYRDFGEYSQKDDRWDVKGHCHRIHAEHEIRNDFPVTISTWQSIYELGKDWFKNFDAVMVDEVHGADADSIKGIMQKLEKCPVRIGFTGTLKDMKTHHLVLRGLFGKIYQAETTRNLMDRGMLSKLDIKMVFLKYDEETRKKMRKAKYHDEMEFLCENPKRLRFIKNMALDLKGNTLVLFQYVDKHGKPLRDLIERDISTKRNVYYVDGDVKGTARDEIRAIVEKETDAIIVASYGTFSTGISINRIHNIIFASPYKSKIKVLQSIGRGLRLSDDKEYLNLFDIVDDMSYKDEQNHVLRHAMMRIEIYDNEKFEYSIHQLDF